MRVWTVQDKAAYDDLCKKGVLHCDAALAEWLNDDCFKKSYDWLASEMKERVGKSPCDVEYPIWAWYLIGGKNDKPGLRRSEFRNYMGEHYLIEAEIPDDNVVLSDEEFWHFVLNDGYLSSAPEDDEAAEEREQEWFTNLPLVEQEQVKRVSWKKIFDKACCPWHFVQATFWELRKEQVITVRKFQGKESRNDQRG